MIATCPARPYFSRAATSSHRILPEQSTSRVTAAGSLIVGSSIAGCQLLPVMSVGIDMASLFRSIDFGVMITTGRCQFTYAWVRNRWK